VTVAGFFRAKTLYSGLHLNEETAGKDARAPSINYADYYYLQAYENRRNRDMSAEGAKFNSLGHRPRYAANIICKP